MLAPKKVKFRKQQKGKRRGMASRGNSLNYGDFGLQSTQCGWLTTRQIEAARVTMTRHIKRGERSGSGFFRTSRSARNRRKPGWEKERAPRKIGWP